MDTIHFEKLPFEKQQIILGAGILCFGRSGYEKTAISEIAKEGQVSKAAIFHYFGNKQDLFIYLVNYVRSHIKALTPKSGEDYFEMLASYIRAHFHLIKKHPGMFEFILVVNHLVADQSLAALNNLSEGYQEINNATVFANVNWEKFRPEYDVATISNLTTWVGNGLLTQKGPTLSPQEIESEIFNYLGILKTALYKPEYL